MQETSNCRNIPATSLAGSGLEAEYRHFSFPLGFQISQRARPPRGFLPANEVCRAEVEQRSAGREVRNCTDNKVPQTGKWWTLASC